MFFRSFKKLRNIHIFFTFKMLTCQLFGLKIIILMRRRYLQLTGNTPLKTHYDMPT